MPNELQDQLRDVCCHLINMIENIDKAAVCCTGCQLARGGGKSSSITDVVYYGVPQGSVLGPILFIIYTAALAPIVSDHGLSLQQYADDSQIYGSCPPAATSSLSTDVSLAEDSVSNWMRSNRLQLNAEKTEVVVCVGSWAVITSSLPHHRRLFSRVNHP